MIKYLINQKKKKKGKKEKELKKGKGKREIKDKNFQYLKRKRNKYGLQIDNLMMMQCSTFDKSLEFLQREYFHDQGQLISLNECRVQTRCPFAYALLHIYFSSFPC